MNRKQLIKKYIEYFKSKDHKEIPNASLIPENDPTVLFTTAGMHPLVPFLLGQAHPQGKRLVNVQRCIRTGDIDEVGDTTHHTFFEMLGNWSLGDYFKKEAIEYTFEFLTKKLNIPIENLAVSVFKGDKNAPKDKEAAEIWQSLGIPKERIAFLPAKDNWWGPAGNTGPCGPCTEQFYWKDKNKPAPKKFNSEDENWVEIGNDVLMQYNKDKKENYNEAKQKNIDFGGGVERTVTILNGFEDNYLTDCWQPIIQKIEKLSGREYGKNERETRHLRIIADQIKAAVFITADGVVPGNTGQGYVLRRLIRRAIRYGYVIGIKNATKELASPVFEIYSDYPHLQKNKKSILTELEKEEKTFEKTLEEGAKAAKKILKDKVSLSEEKAEKLRNLSESVRELTKKLISNKKQGKNYNYKPANLSEKEIDQSLITGRDAFLLFQSYGFPEEMILELAVKQRLLYDEIGFHKELAKHQELSRTASAGKFKSGLADNSEQTTRLHTACHLLNQALREVLKDKNIFQRGSNITSERLRFDFNFDRKLTGEEKKAIEDLVNKKIKEAISVKLEEITLDQAKKQGAQGVFDTKYGDKVKVYSIGKDFSKEICAGPHVTNTKELGTFKITKETSSSAGVRRIKAILE
jgi:alanyl-tRNA synthetase